MSAMLYLLTFQVGTVPFLRALSESFLTETGDCAVEVVCAKWQELGEGHVPCSVLGKLLLGDGVGLI